MQTNKACKRPKLQPNREECIRSLCFYFHTCVVYLLEMEQCVLPVHQVRHSTWRHGTRPTPQRPRQVRLPSEGLQSGTTAPLQCPRPLKSGQQHHCNVQGHWSQAQQHYCNAQGHWSQAALLQCPRPLESGTTAPLQCPRPLESGSITPRAARPKSIGVRQGMRVESLIQVAPQQGPHPLD